MLKEGIFNAFQIEFLKIYHKRKHKFNRSYTYIGTIYLKM